MPIDINAEIERLRSDCREHVADLKVKYLSLIEEINIPEDIDLAQSKMLVAALDKAMTTMYPDFAEARSLAEAMDRKVKTEVARLRVIAFREKSLDPEGKVRGEEQTRRSYVDAQVSDEGWHEASKICNARFDFLERLLALVERKKELLNIDREILRIESRVMNNGM